MLLRKFQSTMQYKCKTMVVRLLPTNSVWETVVYIKKTAVFIVSSLSGSIKENYLVKFRCAKISTC